ncbi:glycosyltransferase family protein [Catellatospora vulcania]|uniref:glycosyltransferase family protein n=1 Tax=Catellatospora vulcania TaxID=1460450 RepID=UPI001E2D67CE|nr:glycosyltransferase family 1 protein [Catellatospora vulcania]
MSFARSTRRATARSARAALRLAASPSVMRSRMLAGLWGAVVSAPGVPDRARRELAGVVHASLLRAGRPAEAARTAATALGRMRNRRARADLLARQAKAELDFGTPPSLQAAVAAELALADALYAQGNHRAAVASLQTAQRQLFDRRLHFDRLTSPLTQDPTGFLSAWHASPAARALSAPRGRRGPAAPLPTDRPVRLLIATYGNHGFLNPIRRHFEQLSNVEVRFLDPGEDGGTQVPMLNNSRAMMEHALAGGSPFGDEVAAWLEPHVSWADVVFVDWLAALTVLFTLVDPGKTRIIARLHSFEAFAVWPHLADYSRIDDLVFVSDFLRDLTVAVTPALTAGGTTPHVVSNAMDLRSFQGDKDADARFTLGLVGIKAVAKDPRWAVEVLRHLRAHDERYRLFFYGHELNADASPDARRYWDGFLADIADLEPSGAVVRRGQTADMPAALREVGVILSTSVRESFHCALVEGAASGAVPVVRDWPFFAGGPSSARTLFPADWMADTPEEAAKRILALTADEQTWREAGAAAAAHAIATWDWEVVKHQFEQLVLGATGVRRDG